MAIGYVQAGQNAGGSPAVTLTLTAHNLVVAAACVYNTGYAPNVGITDTNGNYWRIAGIVVDIVNSNFYLVAYAADCKAGATIVHCVTGYNPTTDLVVVEYSGADTVNPLDGFGITTMTGSSASMATQIGDLCVAFGHGTGATGASWNSRGSDATTAFADKLAATSASETITLAGTPSHLIGASFRPASAPALVSLVDMLGSGRTISSPVTGDYFPNDTFPVTKGNFLFLWLETANITAGPTITDTLGSSWSAIGTPISNGTTTLYCFGAYAKSTGSNQASVAFTQSSSARMTGQMLEFSGMDPTIPYVDQATNTGTSTHPNVALTSTVANSIAIIAATKLFTNDIVGPPPVPWLQSIAWPYTWWGNFTLGTDFGNNGAILAPVASTGAITPQMTITSSAAWGASAFILNPVAAAPAAKPKPVFLLIR